MFPVDPFRDERVGCVFAFLFLFYPFLSFFFPFLSFSFLRLHLPFIPVNSESRGGDLVLGFPVRGGVVSPSIQAEPCGSGASQHTFSRWLDHLKRVHLKRVHLLDRNTALNVKLTGSKMMKVSLVVIFLAAAAFSESVRETETWMPPKDSESHDDLDASGDFIFPSEDRTTFNDDDEGDYEDTDDYDDISGSGEGNSLMDEEDELGEIDNHIPDIEPSGQPKPTINEIELVRQNEVGHHLSVQLSHAGEQNIFNKTEVLAAVIAGGAVGLLFAVLLILLLVYRMKKKDEGSYDLGKKPIYKKAPTTEIYA